jgi:hypothetical protein
MRAITFDLEIQRSPLLHEDGWEAARDGRCGVSCVALHDNAIDRVLLYNEHDLEECVGHLNDAEMLISFNGIDFDTPCLEGASELAISPPQYDILQQVWKALGRREKGWKLDDICKRMDIGGKMSNGVFATDMYRQGRFQELYLYCRNDVHLTRRLADFIDENGFVLTPDGDELSLVRPSEM